MKEDRIQIAHARMDNIYKMLADLTREVRALYSYLGLYYQKEPNPGEYPQVKKFKRAK